jgi:O-antigen/teichoic acid export membrane protein
MSLLADVFRGDFSRQVAHLTTGTALGQLIAIAATPLLTRLYSPADLGVFGLYASFIGVASVVVCWRLDLAVATARTSNEAAGLLALCLAVSLPTSLLLSLGLAVLIQRHTLSFEMLSMWTVPLAALGLAATGVFGALRYWHVARHQFGGVGRALTLQGAGRAGASVAFGLAGTGWAGLALGDLVGRLVGIRRLWAGAGSGIRNELGPIREAGLLRRLREARRFPLVVLPSSVLDALAAALPIPVIATLFGPASAGQFALVWRVATIPSALIASSVADVFHAHAVAADSRDPALLAPLVKSTMKRLVVVATLIYVPACAVAPAAFGWIFGEEWRPAGWLMLLLLPMWWSATVVSPLSRVLIVAGRPALKLVFDLCYLVLPMAALLAFKEQGLERAVLAYGVAAALAFAVYAALLLRIQSRPRGGG